MKTKTSLILQIAAAALAVAIPCSAQPSFVSGSTGSDGALDFSSVPSGQTVVFDPTTYNPPLNPSHNNIFNFTTISIPSGVTVRLSGRKLTGPVYWLATGAVTINGTLDLSGENGAVNTDVAANRTVAYPGAGGYAGGLGGNTASVSATAGQGPAGGAAGASQYPYRGTNGSFTGNAFLVPLIGGSGGGGSTGYCCYGGQPAGQYGDAGGAGGGAILIASSTSINMGGLINAKGGTGGTGGGIGGAGAGGAVHLVAPSISGNGGIYVNANTSNGSTGSGTQNGRIRVETANYTGNIGFVGPYTITATPNLYLPTLSGGTIKAISVNGVSLPASPTGSFVTPDVSINTSNSVPIVIQASNIPVGTAVTLQITSDQGSDMIVTCPALSGTLASSTTTASVVFPAGFSRGIITASW